MNGPPLASVYHLSPRRRLLLCSAWAAIVLPIVGMGLHYNEGILLVTGLISGAIIGIVFSIAGLWYPRLVVSPTGVERHDLGAHLATTWANVASLRLTRLSEGLVLREPMSGKGAERLRWAGALRLRGGSLSFYPPEVLVLVDERRFLPLEAFAYWIDHGTLGEELQRYLPVDVRGS